MKHLIIILAIPLLLTVCCKSSYNTYLTYIQIANGLNDKSTIYFECDNYCDSIAIIHYPNSCYVTINKLWENTHYYLSVYTTNKIYDEIIIKNHFRIYRYNGDKKEYFSFEKYRSAYPYDEPAWHKTIDNTGYMSFLILVSDEYFESKFY